MTVDKSEDERCEERRYIRMTWPGAGGHSCIVEPEDVDFIDTDPGPCVLDEVWMTPAEYEALPEFES